jgi:16S rRNA (uracil1498-N3)-methyltransferase
MRTGRWRTIQTAFSRRVAELRRLLVAPDRLAALSERNRVLTLTENERHYLRRVLRLRADDPVAVIDGCGHLWSARLNADAALTLDTDPGAPVESEPPPRQQLGLAVALVRRGMDDLLRMACELGVDRFQPLLSARCTPQAEHRPERWSSILREAAEQCERLWQPTLHPMRSLQEWSPASPSQLAVAVTRCDQVQELSLWLERAAAPDQDLWLVIGPEGGWTAEEMVLFEQRQWQPVGLAPTILRTSTAGVCAAVKLSSWRQIRP